MRRIIAFDHVSADGYFATEDGMPTREIFVVLFIALYIGWIAVAAVRSNRRHNTDATKDPVHHA